MDAIVTYDLTKQYGDVLALSDLDLQIPQGTVFACVGRPKAGKTTLLRLLSGLCTPTSGECSVMGFSGASEKAKLHGVTGVVLHSSKLYPHMSLMQNLLFFAGVDQVTENDAVERASFLLHTMGIWEARDHRIADLTTGVLHRAAMARALIHCPQVLLIDELTKGHDMETLEAMWAMIARFTEEENGTVLLCTEFPEYVEGRCAGYAFLKEGRLVVKGDEAFLLEGSGLKYKAVFQLAEESQDLLLGFVQNGDNWEKKLEQPMEISRLIAQAVESGISLYSATVRKPTLKEIYDVYMENRKEELNEPTVQDVPEQPCLSQPLAGESEHIQPEPNEHQPEPGNREPQTGQAQEPEEALSPS